MKRIAIALAFGASTVGLILAYSTQARAVDEPENVIKYRRAVMLSMGAHTGAIVHVAKREVSFVGQVAAHARSINAMSKLITSLFPKGTGNDSAYKTRALPKIWNDWAHFAAAAKKLEAESAKLVEVAAGGDVAAIGAQLGNMGKACGGCHKPYRAKLK